MGGSRHHKHTTLAGQHISHKSEETLNEVSCSEPLTHTHTHTHTNKHTNTNTHTHTHITLVKGLASVLEHKLVGGACSISLHI